MEIAPSVSELMGTTHRIISADGLLDTVVVPEAMMISSDEEEPRVGTCVDDGKMDGDGGVIRRFHAGSCMLALGGIFDANSGLMPMRGKSGLSTTDAGLDTVEWGMIKVLAGVKNVLFF